MTDERWPHVKALFQAAVERPIDQRPAFLATAAGDDDVLRREVESLLESDSAPSGFLDQWLLASGPQLAHAFSDAMAWNGGVQTADALPSGMQIGSYQIIALLGAGAMGEVYRARDTRLNREVALKVLPRCFAGDAGRMARFTREAQLLATLNHPNIAAIYGIEESDGSQALVLELVEGPTLAERIALGPIGFEEALLIARPIAEALEAAHDRGIIHRDVKPANVKVARSGTVKVLDFGLAKIWDGAPQADPLASPMLTATDLVEQIAGTPAYMSPEQVRGQALDRRTDIWSFGCVLFEMLTGSAPFSRRTVSDTLAAILERDPDHTLLPDDTPEPVRRLLRRCLVKDPRARLDSAAGARLEIDEAIQQLKTDSRPRAATAPRHAMPAAMAAVGGGVALAALAASLVTRPIVERELHPSRFAIVPPVAQQLNVSSVDRDIALSPDGRHLVYRAGGSVSAGGPLMVRALNELDARPLAAAINNAYSPFFSPDGRWIGFFERSELKKVALSGGPPITLTPFRGASLGASWSDDNTIVFATDDPETGLLSVPASGGRAAPLTSTGTAQRQQDHAFPSFLPGGRGVLFTITAADQAANSQVAVLDLATGAWRTLVRGAHQAEYVEVPRFRGLATFARSVSAGYLLYVAGGALRAVRFDPVPMAVSGEPGALIEDVMSKTSGAANYAVSRSGALLYVPGGASVQGALRSLVWVDRKGHEESTEAPPRAYGPPRLSPDNTRVAVGIHDQWNTEIWIFDLAQKALRRLTFSTGMDGMPNWTRDGRHIVFMSARSGVPNVYMQAADGSGAIERVIASPNAQWATAMTPDGRAAVGFELGPGTGSFANVILTPLAQPDGNASRELRTAARLFEGAHPDISPDGRYVAYHAPGDSGRDEIYVRPFPRVDRGRWQISTRGGTRAAWSRNGREVFYIDESMALMRVPVQTSASSFSMGTPTRVFDAKYAQPNPARHFDVALDGQRFLMVKDAEPGDRSATPASMVVVERWFEELKSRFATERR